MLNNYCVVINVGVFNCCNLGQSSHFGQLSVGYTGLTGLTGLTGYTGFTGLTGLGPFPHFMGSELHPGWDLSPAVHFPSHQ